MILFDSVHSKFGVLILVISLFGCEEILLESNIENTAIELIAPAGSSELMNPVQLTWEQATGVLDYQVLVVSPNFETPQTFILDTILPATGNRTRSVMVDKKLPPGEYSWSIQGLNTNYSTSDFVSSFIVVENSPQ